MYKEELLKDEREIRDLKRELEEQKVEANNELEKLADELRQLIADQKKNKDQSK